MTLLIVLLIAAMVFGVGAVLEGLAWAMIVAAALAVIAIAVGIRAVGRGPGRTRRTA